MNCYPWIKNVHLPRLNATLLQVNLYLMRRYLKFGELEELDAAKKIFWICWGQWLDLQRSMTWRDKTQAGSRFQTCIVMWVGRSRTKMDIDPSENYKGCRNSSLWDPLSKRLNHYHNIMYTRKEVSHSPILCSSQVGERAAELRHHPASKRCCSCCGSCCHYNCNCCN